MKPQNNSHDHLSGDNSPFPTCILNITYTPRTPPCNLQALQPDPHLLSQQMQHEQQITVSVSYLDEHDVPPKTIRTQIRREANDQDQKRTRHAH